MAREAQRKGFRPELLGTVKRGEKKMKHIYQRQILTATLISTSDVLSLLVAAVTV